MAVHGLIDADQMLYTAGFGAQQVAYQVLADGQVVYEEKYMKDAKEYAATLKEHNPDADITIEKYTNPGELEHSLHNLRVQVHAVLYDSGCDTYKMYLSRGKTFRDDILDNAEFVYAGTNKMYKGNRINTPKPQWFNEMVDYLCKYYDVRICEGIEADDAVAIQHTRYAKAGKQSILISADKDLNTVPGLHYNPQKGIRYNVSDDDADAWFFCQMLIGDPADNIAGLPGYGVQAAYNLLQDCIGFEERRKVVMNEYYKYWHEKKGLEFNKVTGIIEDMMDLLWMLREYKLNDDKTIQRKWKTKAQDSEEGC